MNISHEETQPTQAIPAGIVELYERQLSEARVPIPSRDFYKKWLRFFFDFCHKYGYESSDEKSVMPFVEKVRSKKQSLAYQRQARHAVILYHEMPTKTASALPEYPEPTGGFPVQTPPEKKSDRDKKYGNGLRSEDGRNDGGEDVYESGRHIPLRL